MKFDDDIPILTEVLRTRSGRMHAPDPRLTPPVAAAPPPAVDLLPEHLIIIGNDARADIQPYSATEHGAETAYDEPLLAEPLELDGGTIAIQTGYANDIAPPAELPPGGDLRADLEYVAQVASQESERGALLASEGHEGKADRTATAKSVASVSVDAGGSIDAPEAIEGEWALVDASQTPDVDPETLAARMQESVLEDLTSRIDTELDARIAEALRAEVEGAIASLQGGLRRQLADGLRDVVQRAVRDEIARVRADGPK